MRLPEMTRSNLSRLAISGGSGGIVPFVPEQLDLTIVYEPGEEGWILASITEVPGVLTQGRTREEARANVIDALRLMLSPEPGSADDRREREALHLTIAA
jgi:predicted RNase H-like HicB family nuclease